MAAAGILRDAGCFAWKDGVHRWDAVDKRGADSALRKHGFKEFDICKADRYNKCNDGSRAVLPLRAKAVGEKGAKFMDVVGQRVRHSTWGTGTIQLHEGVTITVLFEMTAGGPKTARFQFPAAFAKEFLSAEDERFGCFVNQLALARICAVCGRDGEGHELIDGKRYCSVCKERHTFFCPVCKAYRSKAHMLEVCRKPNSYQPEPICDDCAAGKIYQCAVCRRHCFSDGMPMRHLNGQTLCKACFDAAADVCFCCGEAFPSGSGETVEYEDAYVDVCPACVPAHTFLCRGCEERKLMQARAISKYVPAEAMLCSRCVAHCDACGIALADEQAHTAFYRSYCPVCWQEKHAPCPCCGADFVPDNEEQSVCPDCTEMQAYVQRVKRMDFSRCAYKQISYYGLERMDRCELFTQLAAHCKALEGKRCRQPEGEPYHFLVMRFLGYEVVVTHLPDGVIGTVKHAVNITMTEFRQNRGMYAAYHALERWLKRSDTYVSTPAGRMLIVNYPVLLRVQTAYDKCYGKQWNGPDDYIEIGNYGDTTDFYMIGILCKTEGA